MWIIPVITIALFLGAYGEDIKKDLGITKSAEQSQEKK